MKFSGIWKASVKISLNKVKNDDFVVLPHHVNRTVYILFGGFSVCEIEKI
jgi:hypothetical protein